MCFIKFVWERITLWNWEAFSIKLNIIFLVDFSASWTCGCSHLFVRVAERRQTQGVWRRIFFDLWLNYIKGLLRIDFIYEVALNLLQLCWLHVSVCGFHDFVLLLGREEPLHVWVLHVSCKGSKFRHKLSIRSSHIADECTHLKIYWIN